jgi:hypothetical protein
LHGVLQLLKKSLGYGNQLQKFSMALGTANPQFCKGKQQFSLKGTFSTITSKRIEK